MSSPGRSCPRCASPVAPEARFCPACGVAVARLAPGDVLDGKYEILDKIGEGGMGEVWRARHLHLDEIRIIKVTKPDPAGGTAAARRFQEEARLATLVRHPNVAALYDFSRQADGSYYMVWEFIDGITLEAWLARRGRLEPALAIDVARQVLAGLSEIHAQGIVHRDLSPDNIMLREAPSGVRAKIIDLGIAKRVAAESLAMTGTGLFLGKLKYCSPEQAGSLPSETPIDARSDIYSFGAVLYEMLSGKPLFESTTPEGYLGKHLHAPPPPLDVSTLPEGLGPPLAAIVARTLEKKRERRFPTAAALSEALARLPAAPAAASAEPERAAGPPAHGHPARRIAAAAAAAVVLAAAVWLARGRRPSAAPSGAGRRPTAAVAVAASPVPSAAAAVEAVPTIAPAPAAAASPPAPAPVASPTAAAAGEDRTDLEDSTVRPLSPLAMRQALDLWRASPDEARARRAPAIARAANRFVVAHPAAPLAREIEATLPRFLERQATASLDHAQPVLAHLYYRAYRSLRFAPPDPELERRFGNDSLQDRPGARETPADGR